MKIKRPSTYRIIGIVLCVPTIVSIFMDWVNVVFLDKLCELFKVLDFINSKFSLIEILDTMKKFNIVYDDKLTSSINLVFAIQILSTISLVVLLVAFLLFDSKKLKITSVISFIITSLMFIVFLYSVNMANEYLSSNMVAETKIIEPTAWPYAMLVLTVLIIIDVVVGIDKEKKKISKSGKSAKKL